MKTLIRSGLALAFLASTPFLASCVSDYGRNRASDSASDWEARHMEAHRGMMGYYSGGACPMDGPAVGMRAMTPEQRRAWMTEYMRRMPPEVMKQRMEVMEMQLQMMRDYMATQPGAGAPR